MAKTVAQFRRRVTHLGFEAVRRPGVMFLHTMRKIPVMRNRVIPALLKEELDGIPASDAVDAANADPSAGTGARHLPFGAPLRDVPSRRGRLAEVT